MHEFSDQWSTLIERALEEDVGSGDSTTLSLVPSGKTASARIVSREAGVLSGIIVAADVFLKLDQAASVQMLKEDGMPIAANEVLLEVTAMAGSILTAERTALNFLQRMSGIATETARYVERTSPYGVQVLDTRKTTPTLRAIEKYAVRCGGGGNHRMGLFDRIMIKDNHLAFWCSGEGHTIGEAVRVARARYPSLEVQVEVDTPEQLDQVLEAHPDWVLLDNMSTEAARACVEKCANKCKVEISGSITLDTIEAYAATGADAISVGALTHSVRSLDIGLDWVK